MPPTRCTRGSGGGWHHGPEATPGARFWFLVTSLSPTPSVPQRASRPGQVPEKGLGSQVPTCAWPFVPSTLQPPTSGHSLQRRSRWDPLPTNLGCGPRMSAAVAPGRGGTAARRPRQARQSLLTRSPRTGRVTSENVGRPRTLRLRTHTGSLCCASKRTHMARVTDRGTTHIAACLTCTRVWAPRSPPSPLCAGQRRSESQALHLGGVFHPCRLNFPFLHFKRLFRNHCGSTGSGKEIRGAAPAPRAPSAGRVVGPRRDRGTPTRATAHPPAPRPLLTPGPGLFFHLPWV